MAIAGSKHIKRIFILALIWRAWFAFSLSYIHPDEHLQGPQVVAHELFGLAAQQPWEFKTDHPIRSFVPLWLFYGIPMSLFSETTKPEFFLYAIRAVMACITWVFGDMAIDRLTSGKSSPVISLMFSASSYVTWTYQSHTLSNSFETILVLWFLVIVHEFVHTRRDPIDKHMDFLLLALIVTVGVFNRPTFIFWILLPSFQLLPVFLKHPWSFATFVVSLIAFTGCCISMDTMVYHNANEWVIAPWNNFRYNSVSSNLALHGTHAWYTHLLSTIPQLLGPGIFYIRPKWNLPMQSAIGGIVLLSLVPHQETRFLLPIVPLLCTSMDYRMYRPKVRKVLLTLWFVFNITLGLLMGTLHQGGVIPAQIWLGKNAVPSTMVWWKTYTPPLWILDVPSHAVRYADAMESNEDIIDVLNAPSNLTKIVDMMGSSAEQVSTILSNAVDPIYFVAPFASDHEQFTKDKPLLWHKNLHLSLDLIDIDDLHTLHPGIGIWLL